MKARTMKKKVKVVPGGSGTASGRRPRKMILVLGLLALITSITLRDLELREPAVAQDGPIFHE
jgi:hypothetical protein